jgi:hypothetical protein
VQKAWAAPTRQIRHLAVAIGLVINFLTSTSAAAEQCAQIFFAAPHRITVPSRFVEHVYREGEYRLGIELLGQELRALPLKQRESLSVEIAAHLRRAPKLPTYFVYQKLGPKRALIRLLSIMNSWSENLSRQAQVDATRAYEAHLQQVMQVMRRGDPELAAYTPALVRDVIQLIASEYRLGSLNSEIRLAGSFVNGYAHLRTSDLDIIEPITNFVSPSSAAGPSTPRQSLSPLMTQLTSLSFQARLHDVFRRHQIPETALALRAENTLSHFAPRPGESPLVHAERVSQFVGQVSPVQIVIRRQDRNVIIELEVHRHEESGEHIVQRFPLY